MAGTTDLTVQLRLIADASQLQNALRGVTGGMTQVGVQGSAGFNQANNAAGNFRSSLRDMIGRFSALWVAFKGFQSIGKMGMFGVDFNAEMENAKLGIATLITAQTKVLDATGKELDARQSLNAAYALSEDQVKKLRIAGLETAATTEQLVSAYQDAVGGGLRAGMSLDQIRILTIQTVQAAGAMHVPMNQLNQEIRSILDGTIDRNSRVAIRLGITNAMVTQWRSAGTLFENLNNKMQAFSLAGKDAMGTWTVVLSNVVEASQIVMGEVMKIPFDGIKASLTGLLDTMVDTNTANISASFQPVVNMGKDIAGWVSNGVVAVIEAVVQGIKDMAAYWEANRESLTRFMQEMGALVGMIASFVTGILTAFLKLLANAAIYFADMSASGRATAVAMGILTLAFMRVVSVAYSGLVPGLMAIFSNLYNVARGGTDAAVAMRSFATIIGPGGLIGLAVVAVGALAVAMSYLAGETKRAREESVRLAQSQAGSLVQEKNQGDAYLASLKVLEKLPKGTKAYEDQLKRVDASRNALTMATPAFKGALEAAGVSVKDNTALMQKYADQIERALYGKLNLAQVALAEADKEADKAEKAGPTFADRAKSTFMNWDTSGVTAFKARIKEMRADVEKTRTSVAQLSAQVQAFAPKEETKLVPNKRELTDAEKAKILEHENDLRRTAATIADMEAKGMERVSLADQVNYDLAKAEADLLDKIAALEKSSLTDTEKKVALRQMTNAKTEEEGRIYAEYIAKREKADQEYADKMEMLEADTLERRLARLRIDIEKTVDTHNKKMGIVMTAEQREATIVATFTNRAGAETKRFREGEIDALKTSLTKVEEQFGRTFSLEEKIAWLNQFGEATGRTAESVRELTQQLQEQAARRDDWFSGWKTGLAEWLNTANNAFNTFKSTAMQVIDGVKGAFATGVEGMITLQMNLGQAMDSVWRGIVKTLANAVSQMIAQWVMAQVVQAALSMFGVQSDKARTAASVELAVAETWAAYAPFPYIGAAMAMAQIAAIYASVTAAGMFGSNIGKQTSAGKGLAAAGAGTYNAEGGYYNKPAWGVFGEAGPELIAPAFKFVEWGKGIAQSILAQAQGSMAAGGGSGYHNYAGATIIAVDSTQWENMVASGQRGYDRRKD